MESFLKVLPVTASSPTAYVAYLLTLLAWVVIAWRVHRYRILLRHINSLPSRDRLSAIKGEMGVVEISGGLTAEQWLRSRIHVYYLAGFGLICVTCLAIFAMTITKSGNIAGSIGLSS